MTPHEAAKILIFSQNHYDFRNQRPENVLKRLEPLSLEEMTCTNLNPFLGLNNDFSQKLLFYFVLRRKTDQKTIFHHNWRIFKI